MCTALAIWLYLSGIVVVWTLTDERNSPIAVILWPVVATYGIVLLAVRRARRLLTSN